MTTLEEKLGYEFRDPALLENALTHSSCANESRGRRQSNERLEFLGDSILGMVVADHLYRNHPDLPEGELTRTRAALVCEDSLVEVAEALHLLFSTADEGYPAFFIPNEWNCSLGGDQCKLCFCSAIYETVFR